LVIRYAEFEFSLFGAQHDRLALHPAHHVEGSAGLAAQRHLQQVLLYSGFDGLAQLRGDFEEAIGRAESLDALVRTLMVIIFDPELDSFASGVEVLKLGP